jgi:hypothetical protein
VTQWTNAYWEAMHPFDLGGAYPNFMMDDEGDARLKATYGDNYARSAALKQKYDLANRVNQNIKPPKGIPRHTRPGFAGQANIAGLSSRLTSMITSAGILLRFAAFWIASALGAS